VDDSPRDHADLRVREALAALAAGRPVVVVDDADREDEGDLIFAAGLATPELVAFTVRHTSGFVCVALPEDGCHRLDLPPMHHDNRDRYRTAYRVTVDLRGTGTGISAASRAATIAALGSASSTSHDFVRPGHVVPLMARAGGVLARPGHTESAVDLVRLAGLPPAGALCEIVSTERPGEMARGPELARFAAEHGLVLLSVDDLIRFRLRTEQQVQRVVTTSLPTELGRFLAIGYRGTADGAEHLALVAGPLDGLDEHTPVHLHTECLSGDVLRSTACDCRRALDDALLRFSVAGRGVVVYLRPTGGAAGCDLFSPPPVRSAASGAAAEWILADLGVRALPSSREPAWPSSGDATTTHRTASPADPHHRDGSGRRPALSRTPGPSRASGGSPHPRPVRGGIAGNEIMEEDRTTCWGRAGLTWDVEPAVASLDARHEQRHRRPGPRRLRRRLARPRPRAHRRTRSSARPSAAGSSGPSRCRSTRRPDRTGPVRRRAPRVQGRSAPGTPAPSTPTMALSAVRMPSCRCRRVTRRSARHLQWSSGDGSVDGLVSGRRQNGGGSRSPSGSPVSVQS
jgi:3,4-dihydroxy 2-butanone 4-phosphate synthase/GTP cyclohydrolase II